MQIFQLPTDRLDRGFLKKHGTCYKTAFEQIMIWADDDQKYINLVELQQIRFNP